MNNGWICPKCGKVYAPWVSQCGYCNDKIVVQPVFPRKEPSTGDPFPDDHTIIVCEKERIVEA
jgi:predicted ATP-dependent serine protease